MHKQVAVTLLIIAFLFLLFLNPPQLGIIFLMAGGLIYLFGGKLEGERG